MPRAHETSAMEAFFLDHFAALQRFVYRRLGDRELAEEIAVDCLVLAWLKGGPSAVTAAWLFRTAQNRIGDELRRRTRERRLLNDLQPSPPETDDRHGDRVAVALQGLSIADRHILELQYWEGLSPSQVAELLGVSKAVVWKRSSRAQSRLRMILETDAAAPDVFDQDASAARALRRTTG